MNREHMVVKFGSCRKCRSHPKGTIFTFIGECVREVDIFHMLSKIASIIANFTTHSALV